jgi:hypothetical protein
MESQDTHNINAEKAKKTTYPTLNNKEIKKLEKNQEKHTKWQTISSMLNDQRSLPFNLNEENT